MSSTTAPQPEAPVPLPLSADDAWGRRFAGWASERFPLKQVLLLFPLYAAGALVAKATLPQRPLAVGALDVVGFFAFWSFAFLMRVYDEHKDYELDCLNHPHRVLQRGLITLAQLRNLGAGAVVFMAVVSVWASVQGGVAAPLIAWAVAFGWSLLMLKEFFIHDWLSPRLVPYALSHMVITPMMLFWVACLAVAPNGAAPIAAPVWILCAMSFTSFATFEVARKTKAPADERDTIDSYSKVWGSAGACVACIVLQAVTCGLTLWLVAILLGHLSIWWSAAFVALAAVAIVPFVGFARRPVPGGTDKLETAVALGMLGTYVGVTAAAIVAGGITWS